MLLPPNISQLKSLAYYLHYHFLMTVFLYAFPTITVISEQRRKTGMVLLHKNSCRAYFGPYTCIYNIDYSTHLGVQRTLRAYD